MSSSLSSKTVYRAPESASTVLVLDMLFSLLISEALKKGKILQGGLEQMLASLCIFGTEASVVHAMIACCTMIPRNRLREITGREGMPHCRRLDNLHKPCSSHNLVVSLWPADVQCSRGLPSDEMAYGTMHSVPYAIIDITPVKFRVQAG